MGEEARDSTPVIASKTWAANIILASFIPAAMEVSPWFSAFAKSHPQTLVLFSGVMNLILRHYTTGPIEYTKAKLPNDS